MTWMNCDEGKFVAVEKTAPDRFFPALSPSESCDWPSWEIGGGGPRQAFSLIELVGVLAVLAVLAASLVPAMLKRLDRAAWLAESSFLSSLADGLTQHILRSKNIPAPTTWAQALAA